MYGRQGVKVPIVSVVVPTFNSQETIVATLQSVAQQTFDQWEAIVVDDCSQDSTRDIVAALSERDPRIRLLALQKNHGCPAAPRNYGVRAARGEWIALLDSDDVWHPQKLEFQLRKLRQVDAEFSSTEMVDFADDSEITFDMVDEISTQEISYRREKLRNAIPTSSVLAKKTLLERYPFNEDIRYKAVEDYDCWLRMHADMGSSIKLRYPFLFYRRSSQQISRSKITMLKRVFMVHREHPGTSSAGALVLTVTHALGAIYSRYIRKRI